MSGAHQVIRTTNTLKAKFGGSFSIDADALARAEAALAGLSSQFSQWMQDELTKLDAARAAVKAEGLNAKTAEQLYIRAHDLKGLGTTYEFPIVSRIAACLCRLIEDPAKRMSAPMGLIDAHIDAIKASVRDGIKDVDHPIGAILVSELEGRVQVHQS
ncbi:MAG: Hpt domain-containing protein [Caulobacteraceae bacterium]